MRYLAPNAKLGFLDEEWAKTIQLHDRLHTMICQQCRRQGSFVSKLFSGASASLCSLCDDNKTREVNEGRRPRGIERLWSRIVLYGEVNSNENVIG